MFKAERECTSPFLPTEWHVTGTHVRKCIRKNFFTVRVVRHWHRLLRVAVEPPSLKILKTRLDTAL